MERPSCKCHGEPQRWNTDRRYRAGGFWKCRRLHVAGNARRVRAGATYLGIADTAEQAAQITQHVRNRLAEFKARQASERKETRWLAGR
jgi:hypothetical protein